MNARQKAVFVGLSALSVSLVAAGGPGPEHGRRLADGTGRMVSVPERPLRIVSLAPSVTEILFAVGAGDRVVGVTDFCDTPPEATSLPRIGGMINPDLERIVGLRPDLVVASTTGNYRDDAERIERLGIPVFSLHTPTISSILSAIEQAGDLAGTRDRAARLVTDLRRRLDRVVAGAAVRRPRTLFVIEPDPLIVPGRETFLGEALIMAGADLVTADAGSAWAQYDLEKVLALGPEVILTTPANAPWAERLPGLSKWSKLPAVVGGRVFVVSDSIQHPGPALVDGIEEVARILAEVGKTLERNSGGERPPKVGAFPSLPPPLALLAPLPPGIPEIQAGSGSIRGVGLVGIRKFEPIGRRGCHL
ncbi:MAG TPA: cobalamin-binding protein [Candidatus Polarisedimenticolia bacterium]|nr:cobalamin-binding protein [Candidatus Polarisedimenticolia bacterium]